jgi:hypothetical protein
MHRSLLVGLLLLALPCAALADRARGRERADPPPRSLERAEARRASPERGARHRPRVEIAPPFRERPQPPRRSHRDWDALPRRSHAARDCHPVGEPPQIALFLLGAGGLALLGRRARRGGALVPQRSREIP